MICEKCDPAGHVAVEERAYLERAYEARMIELRAALGTIREIVEGRRPVDRFTGERIAELLRDLDAIRNLQIVVGV